MVKRNSAMVRPSFWHSLNPTIDRLLLLNQEYSELIKAIHRNAEAERVYNLKWTDLSSMDAQSRYAQEREFNDLQMDKSAIKKMDYKLRAMISQNVGEAYSLWDEIMKERSYFDCELSDQKYLVFLKRFEELLNTNNGLDCYDLPAYKQIQSEIIKHLR